MAKQIGVTRVYGSKDEANSTKKQQCPKCSVFVVPRGISSSRATAKGEKHCPNCGHVFGRKNH